MTADLSSLLDKRNGHCHLIGICGVGMAGLAYFLKQRGINVTGCDQSQNTLQTWLSVNGIMIKNSHNSDHVMGDPDWVVRSAAVAEKHIEVQAALQNGIPVFSRGEVLPKLLAGYRSIAVSGTHGKTTTASFITQIMRITGKDPAWCIGGDTEGLGGVASVGKGGELVVEADESDGTLIHYFPDNAVVTNIELDHCEHFKNLAELETNFATFVNQVSGSVIYCADDPGARKICATCPNAVSFGFSKNANIGADSVQESVKGISFMLRTDDILLSRVTLGMHGKHNILNLLAAIAITRKLGIRDSEIFDCLHRLVLPNCRQESVVNTGELTVIKDYAHHPTEITALVSTFRCMAYQRLLAVFQPHRYSRTKALGEAFPRAFTGIDELIITPVYDASEPVLPGGTEWDLYRRFRLQSGMLVPKMAASLEDAWAFLRGVLREGDLLLVIGAGDVAQIAQWAKTFLKDGYSISSTPLKKQLQRLSVTRLTKIRINEPIANKTSFGIGGQADVWIEINSCNDFKAVLRWTDKEGLPFTLLAGGNNVLVSDLGIRGVTAKLTGTEFHRRKVHDSLVVIGAAVTIQDMLNWLESKGLSNLEFMESIPGTLGGGIQMNAGAWGKCLGDYLEWIRCLNRRGEESLVPKEKLDFGYRRCEFLKNHYCIEVAFRVQVGVQKTIAAERAELRKRRAWMSGYRSAGSFFKNPNEKKAGRLLEDVGMHRARVGGAWIGTHHANFLIVEDGASASDVRALAQKGHIAVAEKFSIELEPEVKYLQ